MDEASGFSLRQRTKLPSKHVQKNISTGTSRRSFELQRFLSRKAEILRTVQQIEFRKEKRQRTVRAKRQRQYARVAIAKIEIQNFLDAALGRIEKERGAIVDAEHAFAGMRENPRSDDRVISRENERIRQARKDLHSLRMKNQFVFDTFEIIKDSRGTPRMVRLAAYLKSA